MNQERSTQEAQAYPDWLSAEETAAVRVRRNQLNAPPGVGAEAPRVGLALSGGGIRSATFSLGVVQALARSGVLPKVDFLSTVSGGGYIGSFLGALYARPGGSDEAVKEALTRFPESRPLQWLRSNGRFLAPNGAASNWLAGAVLLRNWVSLLFVLAPAAFFLFFLVALARTGLTSALLHFEPALSDYGWPLHVAGLTLSPLVLVPLFCAVYWLAPSWIAYWMVNAGHRSSRRRLGSAIAVTLTLLVPSVLAHHYRGADWHPFPVVSALVGVTAAAFFGAGWVRWRMMLESTKAERPGFDPFGPDLDSIARNRLSEWLKSGLTAVVVTALVSLVDSVGFAAFQATLGPDRLSMAIQQLSALASGIGAVVLASHRILAQFGSKKEAGPSPLPVYLLAASAAVAILLLGATVISTATYWMVVPVPRAASQPEVWLAGLGVVFAFVAMMLLGHFDLFVNQSSLGPIYSARLTRAYVGASNPNRWKAETTLGGKESPTEPIPGDQIGWDEYKPHAAGGPIHLINVTVNETVDPRVQLHQPDRKGMLMAVGPMGVSLGVRHHASWHGRAEPPDPDVFQVFRTGNELDDAERLPVGHWIAISGAAVATGLGQLGRWGTSLLCGVFNMRLGYWWFSNAGGKGRRHQAKSASWSASLMSLFGHFLPVYRLLAAEFLGRFPGTAIPSWYLTDGGHLENTGCYELIRRRIPFIICIDNGADPEAACSDLANLVRLARVDFGADIEFLDAAQVSAMLDPAVADYFGAVQNLKRDPPTKKVYAALGRVRYAEGNVSWLILVKPTLLGKEPVDISAYGLAHASFPQQSTGDQSFDDAQWEAYRKLGDHIGTRLFDTRGQRSADRWWPQWLDQAALDLLERQYAPPDSGVRRTDGADLPQPKEGTSQR